MATTAGITQVAGTPNTWVQLPTQACTQVIFQKGSFDIAMSATPGSNFFHISSSTDSFPIPIVANANTLWIRASGVVTFMWNS